MKRSFLKFLLAFSTIILTSFLILSAIVTSMIRNYATNDKKARLTAMAANVAAAVEQERVIDLSKSVEIKARSRDIKPRVEQSPDIDVILLSPDHTVLLTTVGAHDDETGKVEPRIFVSENLGSIDLSSFGSEEYEGRVYYVNEIRQDEENGDSCLVYGIEIRNDDSVIGYSLASVSVASEDQLIVTTSRAVIYSSILVMVAALIAAYFITRKIIQPMRSVTDAAQEFAKGKFSTRVRVYGNDEVADLAAAFNKMAESFENYDKMRNSFLASVSHDLRTPMTTIAGFIDGINSGAIPPEKQEHYLTLISSEIHRLSRLVSEILDVSRLQSGERKFNFTDFDITEAARLILISFEKEINGKRLDVAFESDEDSMFAFGDSDAIYQVLYNLCHNAIKFAKDGGRFAITIRRAENKKIAVSVYDEGVSVSEEEAGHIFEQFYKIDASRGLDKKGVGLGLYICKTILDAHGETIRLVPGREDGCEFLFTLKEGTPAQKKARSAQENQ